MANYKIIFLKHFGLTESDFIPCNYCGKLAVDIHHLIFRSQLGKDVIENLIPLCRHHHDKAHHSRIFNDKLKEIHAINMSMYKKGIDYETFILFMIKFFRESDVIKI